jgi:hypothetical protein
MTFPRVSLTIAGLALLGLGTAWLISPEAMGQTARLAIERPVNVVELRAVYGGSRLGLGLFFLIASFRPRWARAALGAQFLVLGATGVARLIGLMLAAGGTSRLELLYASIELTASIIGLVGFRQVKALLLNSRVASL